MFWLFLSAFLGIFSSRVPALCWLGLVAFVPVLSTLEGKSWKIWMFKGAALFFLIALGGYYWIYYVAHDFGGLPAIPSLAAVPVFALMNCWQGFFGFALFGWLKNRVRVPPGILFALCMTVALHQIPCIFHWDVSVWIRSWTPLIQSLDLFGSFGLDFFILWFNYEMGLSLRGAIATKQSPEKTGLLRSLWSLAMTARTPLLLLLLLNLYGFYRLHTLSAQMEQAPKIRALLVQPNIDSGEKRDPRFAAGSLGYLIGLTDKALQTSSADLIVWPESIFPLSYRYDRAVQKNLQEAVERWHAPLLFGSDDYQNQNSRLVPYNAAFFVEPGRAESQKYRKHVLLAFGEYIPLEATFPKIRTWLPPEIGNFGRGRGVTILQTEKFRFNPLICYESIDHDYMRANAGTSADFMAEISNDGWYYQSSALLYHNNLAALRAVENRVGLLRDTNTGITNYIDPLGREHGVLPLEQAAVSFEDVPLYRPYSFFTHFGYLLQPFAVVLLLFLSVWSLLPARKSAFQKP